MKFLNNIPQREMKCGRSETVCVIVLGGTLGGEGKSLFFKTLRAVVGVENVFSLPSEKCSFPFSGIEQSKILLLDDWRFDGTVVTQPTQMLLFDGSPVPCARPQNVPGMSGNMLYQGTSPIFATTKMKDIKRLRDLAAPDPATGRPWDANSSMILRRLKVYEFFKKMEKPLVQVPFCGHCFANLVINQAKSYCESHSLAVFCE